MLCLTVCSGCLSKSKKLNGNVQAEFAIDFTYWAYLKIETTSDETVHLQATRGHESQQLWTDAEMKRNKFSEGRTALSKFRLRSPSRATVLRSRSTVRNIGPIDGSPQGSDRE